jgi:putative transposase
MKKGIMYLTAIIDVFSRFVLAWDFTNTIDASNCSNVFIHAVQRYGIPEIINSDQRSQFTSIDWMDMCSMFPGMKVSMDRGCRA